MILKIDHLAFCTTHMEHAIKAFETLGYDLHFKETGLRDLENKKDLMQHFSGTLDMTFMTRRGSISIELLDHGHATPGDSYILPVLECALFDVQALDDSFAGSKHAFLRVQSDLLKTQFFIPKEMRTVGFQCNTAIAETDNLEQSAVFWRHLGFNPISIDHQVTHLEFKAPLSKECFQLFLRKKDSRTKQFGLDTQGFNCIAFMSTDTEKDRRKFESMGMAPTETNLFRVNGRDLYIFWTRGPGGEIVEIIGLTGSLPRDGYCGYYPFPSMVQDHHHAQ